jgi:hypothetical protein
VTPCWCLPLFDFVLPSCSTGASVVVNFGAKPFEFDLEVGGLTRPCPPFPTPPPSALQSIIMCLSFMCVMLVAVSLWHPADEGGVNVRVVCAAQHPLHCWLAARI